MINQNFTSNPGISFDLNLIHSIAEDKDEIDSRIEKLTVDVKGKDVSKIDVLKLISCVDLTSLAGADTSKKISTLLKKAEKPIEGDNVQVASVCVYQTFVKQSRSFLADTQVGVATVAGGFPAGQMDLEIKLLDIEKSVALGANEIDVVINRSYPLTENWEELFNEVSAFKKACKKAKLKVIMATGELADYSLIAKTSFVCMMAGADFIKTSTGMEKVNATLQAGYVMMKAIKGYFNLTNTKVGIKPAGGIRSTEVALQWLSLLEEELGQEWCNNTLFRIGASGLLDDLTSHLN